MASHIITPLNKLHNRVEFCSLSDELNHYLKKQISQEIRRKVAAAFVLTEKDSLLVKGFYTLSASSILLNDLPESMQKKLPKYPSLPATLLGRLAVDGRYSGQGLGRTLLIDALYRSWQQSGNIASMAVVVDAIDENAVNFYKKYHFIQFQNSPSKLFITMKEIESLVKDIGL